MSETYNCPKCTAEELIRIAGNILVCASCDLVLIEPKEEPKEQSGEMKLF